MKRKQFSLAQTTWRHTVWTGLIPTTDQRRWIEIVPHDDGHGLGYVWIGGAEYYGHLEPRQAIALAKAILRAVEGDH